MKDMKNIFRDVGGYNISCGEIEQICRKSREEDYNYLCTDRSKERDHGTYCICNENKNIYTDCSL